MSEKTSTPAEQPQAAPAGDTVTEIPVDRDQQPGQPGPYAAPYGATPQWAPAGPVDAAGAPAWAPAAPAARTSFRDRIVKLWLALTVGAAALVVGLGVGVLVGHETAGSGSGSNQFQPPGMGQGFGGRDGNGGQGFGGQQGQQGQQQGQQGSSSGTTSGTLS